MSLKIEFTCGFCGGLAFEAPLGGGNPGRARRCWNCGHPGVVVLDDEEEPLGDMSWESDDENCRTCAACCDELKEQEP